MTKNPFDRDSTKRILDASFGGAENLSGSKDDIYALAQNLIASGKTMPRFYTVVGQSDSFLTLNRRFNEEYGAALGLCYNERPGGHTWKFWSEQIRGVFEWLNINGDK